MEVVEQKKLTVPKLRFREFEDGWKKEPIGNYINLFSGVALKGEEISEEQGGIPILRGINITEGFIRHNEKIDRFYHGEISGLENLLIQEGDLVLGMDGSKVGKNSAIVSAIDVGAILIQRVACLRPKKNGSIEFVFHHIHSSRFHQYVDVVNTSSGIPHISSKQIKDFRIWFPTLPEQQKIAGFLSAVDEKLQHLNCKKELLQQYKKGVMQKLFSQELRFKRDDGSDYEDWEEKRIGDVLTIGSGRDYKHLKEGDIPVLGTGGYMLSVNECLYDGETVFVGRKGTIDKPFYFNGPFWTVDTLFYTHEFKKVVPKFIYAVFQQINWLKFNEASGVPSLSKKTIESIEIDVPSVDEQQKIADFLSSLDEKIDGVSAQIEKTQQFKKGLLQEMFV